ncbi:MAG: hypothetical protein EAZ08_11145 [Cytophagales bacterium]|nr:MAG: hypothetical protein EAZ08_11145 [Cytophagales bacterium]
MMKKLLFIVFFISTFHLLSFENQVLAQILDMDKLKGMQARSIGPAGMSGRVTAIAVPNKYPDIIYLGAASGGVWKSTNGGISFTPIFDEQKVSGIGAIAIDQNNPDIVWVGTGEGNPRNSQNNGQGIYRSMDGGKTWDFMGLEKTSNIHRVLLHPQNPDIVYVGVQGSAWGDHPERGVFKTTDGGKTWEKVLYVNERTGISELVIDPQNPNKLIAGMWEFHRDAWFFKSGGKGSGMYITFDGGKTWKQRTKEDGLPEGELGKMGFAIPANKPNIIYALVEAKKNGLYKSEDGGFKWTAVKTGKDVMDRPFYYCEIYADPKNENRLIKVETVVRVSEDGGKNFKDLIPYEKIHPDHHAFWIHPENPNYMIDGNDGGAAISRDGGKSWIFIDNLPLGQYYHINVDNDVPYNIYGGLQDNGSWRTPSQVWREQGIKNIYTEMLSFGDGFDVIPDLDDNRYGFSMSQGGNLVRYDILTGEGKFVKPAHADKNVTLRFNWNAGIAQDPFSKSTIYYGSQFVHKSSDKGDSWETISPDLTTNDSSKQNADRSGGLTFDATFAENYTTIMAIAPSSVKQGVIWVGTDDGNLQVTQDGGKTWANVIKNVKGVPANTWIPQIQTSKYNAGEALVVFDNHRRNDWTPFVYRTKDFGQTWERIVDDKKVFGYVWSVIQDPVEPNLIFVGTETGLYVSIDGSKTFTKWKNGYPTVPTADLVIHPREHDLVIGTFGRALYVIDDIRPLRVLAKEGVQALDKPLKMFEIPDAYLVNMKNNPGIEFPGDATFAGENKKQGALLSFVMNPEKKETKTDSVKVEIFDASNNRIRTFKAEGKTGLNRITWDLNKKGVRMPMQPKPTTKEAPEPRGTNVLPATYKVRITYGKNMDSAMVNVKLDPRLPITQADMQARDAMFQTMYTKVSVVTEAMDRLREAKQTISMVNRQLGDSEEQKVKDAKKMGKDTEAGVQKLIDKVIAKDDIQGIFRSADILSAKLFGAMNYLGYAGKPTPTAQVVMKHAETDITQFVTEVNAFFEGDWKKYQQTVESASPKIFKSYDALKMN